MKDAAPQVDKGRRYVLQLYINSTAPGSMHAIANIRRICEERLHDRYDLEIIDISRQPGLANEDQVIAIPTLIKKLPLPVRRFVGDMSQEERILHALEI